MQIGLLTNEIFFPRRTGPPPLVLAQDSAVVYATLYSEIPDENIYITMQKIQSAICQSEITADSAHTHTHTDTHTHTQTHTHTHTHTPPIVRDEISANSCLLKARHKHSHSQYCDVCRQKFRARRTRRRRNNPAGLILWAKWRIILNAGGLSSPISYTCQVPIKRKGRVIRFFKILSEGGFKHPSYFVSIKI